MRKDFLDLTCETDYFSARQTGAILTFSFKGNMLLSSSIIKAKETVLGFFESVNRHPEIRVVLLLANPRKARKEEFLSFFDMVRSARLSRHGVLRMYRAMDQLMLHILSSDVFFINADCGQILPMFVNLAQACDYRIIGDNAVFQNPSLELGMFPKGGGAWFLTRRLGRQKAFELLLTHADLSAREATRLGLFDRCVPLKDFETEAASVAEKFAALPASSLTLAKRLINYASENIADYLEFENQELVKTMNQIHRIEE